jgi:hypothetical protein
MTIRVTSDSASIESDLLIMRLKLICQTTIGPSASVSTPNSSITTHRVSSVPFQLLWWKKVLFPDSLVLAGTILVAKAIVRIYNILRLLSWHQ